MDNATETTRSPRYCWHILTCEYPPAIGGVADYTAQVAEGLARHGAEVHVWCSATESNIEHRSGVLIHWVKGRYNADFRKSMTAYLDDQETHRPYRILVQYAPHGFGLRAMNVPFCWWLLQRKRKHNDEIRIMFHEVAYPLVVWPIKHIPLGWVTRGMAAIVVRAASHVYVSIPAWAHILRPLGRQGQLFDWLPVPSGLESLMLEKVSDSDCAKHSNASSGNHGDTPSLMPPPGVPLVGHFGTYGGLIASLLRPIVIELLQRDGSLHVVFIGRGSDLFCQFLAEDFPELCTRLHATGQLDHHEIANHVMACDVMIQPYPDGISTRRTSVMASLVLGVPSVSTSGLLTESIWAESDLIPLSQPNDVDGFVTNTLTLLGDPMLRAKRSEQLKAYYHERFSIEKMLVRLEED